MADHQSMARSLSLDNRQPLSKVVSVTIRCQTCGDRLTGTQRKYCGHACLATGANKARVRKMFDTRIERFWDKVAKGIDCWVWTAYVGEHRYGVLKFEGKVDLAHRVAWNISHPDSRCDDWCVLHKCDNPPCVRPDHLFLGTKQDNSDDMVAKGRSYDKHGQLNPNNKLTPDQVLQIKALKGKLKQKEIAVRFGINQPHVSRILRGQAWKKGTEHE